jgi:hypothetical protein
MIDLFQTLGGPKVIVALLIPLVGVAARKVYLLYVRHRILGFGTHGLDVVLTATNASAGEGRGIARPSTGIGSVHALTIIANVMGRYYARLSIDVHLASRVESRLQGDLVCIGGPRLNAVTEKVLRSFTDVSFDDVGMHVASDDFVIKEFDLKIRNGKPARDVGLVFVATNPLATRRRRLVLCCGMTSYGTAAAAQWLFGDVMSDSLHRPASRKYGVPWRGVRADEFYTAILEFEMLDGRAIGQRVLHKSLKRISQM